MSSWANSLDLHLELPPGTRGAREQLTTSLRDAVRSGRLGAGTKLPPSRSLAVDLGLARNTVAEAYAELVAEGWLASRQGSGTWVVNAGRDLSEPRPRGVRGVPVHNLLPGSPDVSAFPREAWVASVRRALYDAPNEALRMGDPRGRVELRTAVAEYVSRVRGVRCSPESVVICAGTRHAVEAVTRVFGLTTPVAVEAYGLFVFRDCIAEMGGHTVPIVCDDEGARVSDLWGVNASSVLVTPAHHFPHGVPLHPTRRAAIVDWARETDGYVIEDDYDGEFRYDRQPIGAVQSLDPDRVVYVGSTSKSMSPVLRLGWMVVPTALVDHVVAAMGGQQWYVDGIAQLTMADFIVRGQYDRHVRRMRLAYRRRRDLLVAKLSRFSVGVGGLSAGLHVLVQLPSGSEPEVLRRAGQAGIALSGLSRLRHPLAGADVPRPDGVVVSFGTPAEHAFEPAVDALCGVLADSGL